MFTDSPAVRQRVPLLLGISGCSGSGKTYSMLELLTGMQEVIGGDIYVVDTEHKRATFYADIFKFRHIPFDPPFSPTRYLEAIEYCVNKGAQLIGVDSMTHEHSGEGGVMDQSEQYLNKKCGEDEAARKRNFMLSLVGPKSQRKKLNSRIVQMGINAVLCYRAADKIKPVAGKEPEKLGWQPETTSPLFYDMAQMFLLGPGADGVPTFAGETKAEKMLIKTPAQFRDWFKDGQRLDRAMGRRMAQWAAGSPSIPPSREPVPPQSPTSTEGGTGRAEGVSSGAPSPAQQKSRTVLEVFLSNMARCKAEDQETYYRVLGSNGFTHANEIRDVKKQKEVQGEIVRAIQEVKKQKQKVDAFAKQHDKPGPADIGEDFVP